MIDSIKYQKDRLLLVKGLGITLEAGGVKDESSNNVGVDVGRGAAVLKVAEDKKKNQVSQVSLRAS